MNKGDTRPANSGGGFVGHLERFLVTLIADPIVVKRFVVTTIDPTVASWKHHVYIACRIRGLGGSFLL